MIRDVYSDSGSQIWIFSIPNPGVKKAPDPRPDPGLPNKTNNFYYTSGKIIIWLWQHILLTSHRVSGSRKIQKTEITLFPNAFYLKFKNICKKLYCCGKLAVMSQINASSDNLPAMSSQKEHKDNFWQLLLICFRKKRIKSCTRLPPNLHTQFVPKLTLTSVGRLEMRVPGARTGGAGGGLTAPPPSVLPTAFGAAWRAAGGGGGGGTLGRRVDTDDDRLPVPPDRSWKLVCIFLTFLLI